MAAFKVIIIYHLNKKFFILYKSRQNILIEK